MKRRKHTLKNEDNNKDTLCALPDCVLVHILSFLNVKEAIRTCVLSTRWKHIWKHLTTLTLDSSHFSTRKDFTNFVNRFLSLRDSCESPTALKVLDFKRTGNAEPRLFKRILTYAVSHHVNRLRLHCRIRHSSFPRSFFSCQSLTSLDLDYQNALVKFPNSMNLPALNYLKLRCFSFCTGNDGRVEPFSTFNRLNTLILYDCMVGNELQPLYISSTTLLNLCIHKAYVRQDRQRYSNIVLFAPSLCIFDFTVSSLHELAGSHLFSIKQLSIDLFGPCSAVESSSCLLNWLVKVTNIESLTVTPTILWALSLYPDILKLKLPFLCNMKSLLINLSRESYRFSASSWRVIKMELAGSKSWKENAKLREIIKTGLGPTDSSILDGMIDFLLQKSPSAKVEIVEFPLFSWQPMLCCF